MPLASDFSGMAGVAVVVSAVVLSVSGALTALCLFGLYKASGDKKVFWLLPIIWAAWMVIVLLAVKRWG